MLISEFLDCSQKAWQKVKDSDPRSPLRYGQALYIILPDEFFQHICQTDNDFFYWNNGRASEIDQICYSMCEDYEDMKHLGMV